MSVYRRVQYKFAMVGGKVEHPFVAEPSHRQLQQGEMIPLHVKVGLTLGVGKRRGIHHDQVVSAGCL